MGESIPEGAVPPHQIKCWPSRQPSVETASTSCSRSSNDKSLREADVSEELESDKGLVRNSCENFSRCLSWDEVSASQLSTWMSFAEPDQTLIFFDWDDTLFPTTEIIERWGKKLDLTGERSGKPAWEDLEDKHELLLSWQQALLRYLTTACSLGKVVIVTNARSPWVETCIEEYAPNLKPLFESKCGPTVVYAREVYRKMIQRRSVRSSSLRPVKHVLPDAQTEQQQHEELMKAKYYAMRREATAFYRQYAGQSWKNILSLGDMLYEYEAVQELGMRRRSQQGERLRIKSLLLPGSASLSELTLRLNFSCLMLPVYARFDGDFKVNLRECKNPLSELSKAVGLPGLAETGFPLHAWGLGSAPSNHEAVQDALGEVAIVVKE
eukprot:gb/GFBE01060123.1/.p1 GENE.gb/GFBE01060123.1/~~gb/GFBE01060123.1/.p1  ORF type:complete len:382 (+),score=88.28 gb/GFBE01060123.1/:1-1146(+)